MVTEYFPLGYFWSPSCIHIVVAEKLMLVGFYLQSVQVQQGIFLLYQQFFFATSANIHINWYSSSFEMVSVSGSGNSDNTVKVSQTSLSVVATVHVVFLSKFETLYKESHPENEKKLPLMTYTFIYSMQMHRQIAKVASRSRCHTQLYDAQMFKEVDSQN